MKTGEKINYKSIHKKLFRIYSTSAIVIVNTAALFLLLNCIIWVILKLLPTTDPYTRAQNELGEIHSTIYPNMTDQEIQLLLKETGSRPFVYEPFVDFKSTPIQGKYVNVSEVGFRHSSPQSPWPPDPSHFVIFLFGGSTAFGWGLPDDQTIASHLQRQMQTAYPNRQVSIYNFATPHYYSTIERIQFEQLLLKHHLPNAAIFIDGMNEFTGSHEDHVHASYMQQFFSPERFTLSYFIKHFINALPVSVLIKTWLLNSNQIQTGTLESISVPEAIGRYLKNKTMIERAGNAFNIQTLFMWQPVPNYKINPKGYLFADLLQKKYIGGLYLAPGGYDEILSLEKMDC